MKIAFIRVPVSERELQLLREVADRLQLPIQIVLSKGAYAYAGMCGFWTDGPPSDVRLSPLWEGVERDPLVSSVTVPFGQHRLRQVERGWGYVRVPEGSELVRVSLGDFIVIGTLRALLLTKSLRDRLAGLQLLTLEPLPATKEQKGLLRLAESEGEPR